MLFSTFLDSWLRHQVGRTKQQINRRKNNSRICKDIGLEAARQWRLIHHPELGRGIVVWGFKGEERNSQREERSKCLTFHAVSLSDEKVIS